MFDANELAAIKTQYLGAAQEKINLLEAEMKKLQDQMDLKQKQLDFAKVKYGKIEEKYNKVKTMFGSTDQEFYVESSQEVVVVDVNDVAEGV